MTSEIIDEPISKFEPSRASTLQEIETDLRKREEKAHLESDLHLTLEEIARLQNALAEVQMQLVAYQKQLFRSKPPSNQESNFLLTFLKDVSQQISTIQGYSQLLKQSNPVLSEMQEEYIKRITDAASFLGEMNHQLSMGHSETISKTAEPESIKNFSVFLTQILSPKIRLLEQKQITLQPIISDRIPEFKTDKAALIKIIDLLLSNALTVTPVDSIVKITANTINIYKQRVLQITIKDGGPGMNLKDLDHLLSPEVSLDEILPGLSIPRSHIVHLNELVESHKGSLEIHNGLDYGTIFEVHLPMD